MKKLITCTAAMALSATVSATVAQADWSGPYAGLSLGDSNGDTPHDLFVGAPIGLTDYAGDSSPEGALVGGFVGYEWQKRQPCLRR